MQSIFFAVERNRISERRRVYPKRGPAKVYRRTVF
jgi:hypothetical protein